MRIAGFNIWPVGSLRFRLFAAFSLFTLLISATFTAIYISREISSHRSRATEKAHILASELATAIRLPLFAEDIPTLERYAAETGRYADVHLVNIRNASGRLLAETRHSGHEDPHIEIGGEVEVRPESPGSGVEEIFGGSPGSGAPLGWVRVEMDDADLHTFVASLLSTSIIIALCFWVVVSLLGVLFMTRITRSLNPLFDGLEALKAGDLSARIPVAGKDEIAAASTVINDLAAELERRQEDNLRLQQELLDTMKNEVSEERRRVMARLIQTNRMTSLGLLVCAAAHEINTPNGAIRLAGQQIGRIWSDAAPILDRVAGEEGGFSMGGMEYGQARDQLSRSTDVIIRSSERIDRVVRDLREYSTGAQTGLDAEVSVNQVVDDTLTIVRAFGRHGHVTMEKQQEENIPPVSGSRYQLEQVVTNLVLNAVQAVPADREGRVAIATGYDIERGEVFISVRDNGSGIPEQIRGSLFEPFFTTRINEGGSGLGLYISDYILREHGGTLTFESELGAGSTFTARIPLAA